jgi:hypothetical protein
MSVYTDEELAILERLLKKGSGDVGSGGSPSRDAPTSH